MNISKIYFLYFGVLFLIAVFSYLFIDPNLSYLHILYTGIFTQSRLIFGSVYLVLLAILFALYMLLLNDRIHVFTLKRAIIVSVIILVLSYPGMLSHDVFNYMTMAKVLFFYGENPYVVKPIEFIGEPYLQFTHFANTTTAYGPVWTLLSGIPYVLGMNSFIPVLFGFKFMNALFYLLTCYIIWSLNKNPKSLLFFALNPLVLIEVLISSHNDIVMMFFALLSYHFLHSRKHVLALITLALSIGIKYATVVLLPVVIYVIVMQIIGKKVNYKRVYGISFLLLFSIFLASFFRVEIYPWYAVWFLSFVALMNWNRLFHGVILALTFGLMLRYLPFMITGDHFGLTPIARGVLTSVPMIAYLGYELIYRRSNLGEVKVSINNMLELKHNEDSN